MADITITALTANTTPLVTDIIPMVDDPAGTPLTQKITFANVLSLVYPIGSVFTSVVSTSPATLFGFGTWSAIASGRVLIGLNSGDTDFDVVEKTGGAKTVTSTGSNSGGAVDAHSGTAVANPANESAHTHASGAISWPAGVPTNAAHTHDNHTSASTKDASSGSATTKLTGPTTHSSIAPVISWPAGVPTAAATAAGSAHTHTQGAVTQPSNHVFTQPTFTGNATSVVQPYYVVYFWKRTA